MISRVGKLRESQLTWQVSILYDHQDVW
jgi:hypothetical protein